MVLNISLPTLSDISDKQNTEKIKGYLETLHNQLQYMMMNIEEDNLSSNLSQTISVASENADKVNWLISDGKSSTDFTLTSYSAELIAQSIKLQGFVEFSDLSNSGKTFINGNNIISGTISADKLDVTDLSALSASIGGWSINGTSISSSASGYGAFYLNSATSNDPYWIRSVDPLGNTTFSIEKNGACFINGNYISNGTITADKIITDSVFRLDLSNNNGVKIGPELLMTNGNVNCRLLINKDNMMVFDTGKGNTRFSLALEKNGSSYRFFILDATGIEVGSFNL